MKKLVLIAVLFIGGLIAPKAAEAQIQVRVNIGVQPIWGPVGFEYVEYYYIPEIDVYYHVPSREFIYYKNGRWVATKTLPSMYRHFDFYRARVVVINEYRPFLRHNEIQRRYANYRDFRPYVVIRDARDPRYFANRNHPEHYRWLKERERRDDRYRDDRNRRDNDRRYNDRRDNDRRDNDRKKVVKKNSKDNNKKDNRNDNRDSNRNDNRDNNRSGGSIYRR